MSSWLVFAAVGLGSALFRIAPLVAARDTVLPPRLEQAVHHGGTAAVTSLVVSSTVGAARGSIPLAAVVAAVLAGLVLAVRGRSMSWVVVIGIAVAVAATLGTSLVAVAGGLL